MTMLDYYPTPRSYQDLRPIRVWNTSTANKPINSSNKSPKKTTKTKLILTLICWTISLSGFLYQTSQLFSLYFSGKTIVNNGVERLKSSKLPAITVCLPLFMSFEKYAQTYPEHKELYSQYLNQGKKWSTSVAKKFIDDFYAKQPTLDEMFKKFAIESQDSINVEITAYDEQGKTQMLHENRTFRSIIPGYFPKICFTIFSDLDKKYRVFKTQVKEITLKLIPKPQWYPYGQMGPLGFTVHSANTLPDHRVDQNFHETRDGNLFLVKYNEIQTLLLPYPYETNCRNYEMEGKGENMRSDCILKCVTQIVLKECQLNCLNPKNNKLLIREGMDQDYLKNWICDLAKLNKTTVGCLETAQLEAVFKCDDNCLKNCNEIYYELEVEKRQNYPGLEIKIYHDSNPDQIIEHRPIMQWLDLVSSFCGLLGMWLGLSIVFLCEYCIRLI